MINELKRFIVCVDVLSFTKAAEKLHITQPALSLSIQRLEKQIKAKLFQSNLRHLVLTSEGKIVYDIGKKIVASWERLNDATSRQNLIGKKQITLGAFDNAALKLAPFFNLFSENNSLYLDLIIDDSNSLRKQLFFGLLDVCICVESKQNILSQEIATRMYSYEEPLFPFATAKWKHTSLRNTSFILHRQGSTTREYIDEFFLKKRISPHIVAESTSTSFMKELALLGHGVVFLPENIVTEEVKNKKLFVVSPSLSIKRTVGVYVAKSSDVISQKNFFLQMKQFLK